ncbi:hypothetical protein [Halospeciosus flavus]|uniref:hypothetical protein n=1 Tax=Halospeciosus flavus TaxID=3032283 RepID=UPI003606137D
MVLGRGGTLLAAFWLASVVWVGALVGLTDTPGLGAGLVVLPLVALGIPIAAVALVLPFALYRDVAVVRTVSEWDPSPTPYVAGAVGSLVAALAAIFGLAGHVPTDVRYGILLGCVLVWAGVALTYVGRRRRHVETTLDALRE